MQADIRPPNRAEPTLSQRINPLWWLGDVERPATWQAWRWFLRNPCANFHSTIIGICHRPRLVNWARGGGWTFATTGWNWGWSRALGGWIRLPFISWRGRRIEAMVGWKTSGAFGYALRRANSPNAEPQP